MPLLMTSGLVGVKVPLEQFKQNEKNKKQVGIDDIFKEVFCEKEINGGIAVKTGKNGMLRTGA